MVLDQCPGSAKFKRPAPEFMQCPSCKEEIEIWTDEIQAVCPKCKKIVTRPTGQSCLDWCAYAKECVGDKIYNKFIQNKNVTIKQKLLQELKDYFGKDIKRINHAERVLAYAESLLKCEKGDWHIVIPASLLHDVGIKVAEEKYGSSAGHHQETEGPAVAENILLKIGLKKTEIEEICQIIAHHHSPGKVDTQNFRILYDADWLVNLKDEVGLADKEKLRKTIDKVFLTEAGREMAKKIYLGKEEK